MSNHKQKMKKFVLEDGSTRYYPDLLTKAGFEDGFSFGATNLDQYWQLNQKLKLSDKQGETYAEVCPKLPVLEYNGVPFVATTHQNKIGLFHVAPVGVPHLVKVLDNNYVIYKAEVETESNSNEVTAIHEREVLLDTRDTTACRFMLELTILTVESSYDRYTEDNFLGYLVDHGWEHKKIRRLARITHHWTKNRKEFTEPLLTTLNSDTLDQFYDLLTAKINFYYKDTADTERFTQEQKDQEQSTVSPYIPQKRWIGLDNPVFSHFKFRTCLISADWYLDLLDSQITGGSKHQADYVHEAIYEDVNTMFLQSTHNPLVPWSTRSYAKKQKKKYDDEKGNQHTNDSKLDAQVSQVLKDVEQQKDLKLSKTASSTLFIESKHLIHTVEHWGLTEDKIKDILSQQSSSSIFDIAKHLIASYTSDPKIYTEKRLIIDRGYKGFTERLSDEYSTKFNEVHVKDALLWWDSVRIRHGNSNVPAQTIFTLDGRPSQDQLLINYGQAITNPVSKRLVPILNHPNGKNKARVVWNKLGLALSKMLVDESLIYKSSGGAGIPFGNEQINILKSLVKTSERRTIINALKAFEDAEAIERSDGFLKLGPKNKDQESTILEGASLTQRAIKNARNRTKSKAGKSKKK